jgi:hypothetical protein
MLKIRKHRRLNLIIKELCVVTNLISMNRNCCKEFPDDYCLKLNLYSLQARKNELVHEMLYSFIPLTWR